MPPCLRAESALGVEERSLHFSSVSKRVKIEPEKLLLFADRDLNMGDFVYREMDRMETCQE